MRVAKRAGTDGNWRYGNLVLLSNFLSDSYGVFYCMDVLATNFSELVVRTGTSPARAYLYHVIISLCGLRMYVVMIVR
jgi:hypothetical protein